MTTASSSPQNDRGKESGRKLISVIVPARNEEGNIPRVHRELTAVLEAMPNYDFEVIVVDNNSSDQTAALVWNLCRKDPRWRFLRFSRDFGPETSMAVGLRLARGHAAITVFSDLQDPPSHIADFVRKWEEGYDVVYGVIRRRSDQSRLRSLLAKTAYRIIRFLSDVRIPVDAGDFRLIDRRVIDAVNRMEERERFLRGMIHWAGFRCCPIPYDRRPRQWGRSKAPIGRLFFFTLNAITCFSAKPLRLFLLFGLVVLCGSIGLSIWYVLAKLVGSPPPGVVSILVLLSWNLAVVSLGIGVLGEYIGHIYVEVKHRPHCFVEAFENIEEERLREATFW